MEWLTPCGGDFDGDRSDLRARSSGDRWQRHAPDDSHLNLIHNCNITAWHTIPKNTMLLIDEVQLSRSDGVGNVGTFIFPFPVSRYRPR